MSAWSLRGVVRSLLLMCIAAGSAQAAERIDAVAVVVDDRLFVVAEDRRTFEVPVDDRTFVVEQE